MAVALSGSGCYLEAAATYYPVIEGGERVADSGWGFALNLGWGLKYRRVRAHFGRGYEVAVADYQDATGEGVMAHSSRWTAGVDVELLRLSRRWWGDLSVGGTWGEGTADVTYDEGAVMDPDRMNPTIVAETWSAFAGPSFHYDRGMQYDLLFTAAPIVLHSDSAAFDPFTGYGATVRFTLQLGLDPPDTGWNGFGFVALFRHGYDADEANRRFQDDQRRFHKRQGDLQDQERQRQEQEKKEKQRCEQSSDC